ncbi:MAG: hypothetical protein ACRDHK_04985, partial [Actinomycetota bacterium]
LQGQPADLLIRVEQQANDLLQLAIARAPLGELPEGTAPLVRIASAERRADGLRLGLRGRFRTRQVRLAGRNIGFPSAGFDSFNGLGRFARLGRDGTIRFDGLTAVGSLGLSRLERSQPSLQDLRGRGLRDIGRRLLGLNRRGRLGDLCRRLLGLNRRGRL